MADIQQFSPPGSTFDAQTTALLGAAYDKVIAGMHDRGQPELVREIIAKHIIELATNGERDIGKLCQGALARLGLSQEEC
jgi:hypothetical protein